MKRRHEPVWYDNASFDFSPPWVVASTLVVGAALLVLLCL